MSSVGLAAKKTRARRKTGSAQFSLLTRVEGLEVADLVRMCSHNCRARRIKCDEQKPCSYCARRGFDCKQPEFIVPDPWSALATTAVTAASQSANTASTSLPTSSDHGLESTYDVFRQVYPHAQGTVQHVARSGETAEETLSEESAELLRIYQRGIGPWMDIFDHSYSYQRQVVRYALSSPLLLHAACALSAKQMSLIGKNFLWESASSRFYGESLTLLIRELTNQTANREILLSATILLCGFELLAAPGVDYQRHLYGARTLVRAYDIATDGSKFEHASFWIYARQDIASAIANERTTLTPPAEWPAATQHDEAEEDKLAKTILWLLARLIEVKFSNCTSKLSKTYYQQLEKQTQEIDSWWRTLPSSARGVRVGNISDNGLDKTYFHVPSAASGCLYYHMAKILALESLVDEPGQAASEQGAHTIWAEDIQFHSLAIASICLCSDIADGVLVAAVNPVFYAARHIRSLSQKFKLWTVLENIEARLGFHTQDRLSQLQREMG